MLANLIASAGGRGFVYAVAFGLITAGLAQWGTMTWDQWVEFNKATVYAFMAAKGVEGVAGAIKSVKEGAE